MNAYILEKDEVVQCLNPARYAEFASDCRNTQIRKDSIRNYLISTVFIGIGEIKFETAVFLSGRIIALFRAETMPDASRQHMEVLKQIERREHIA